jgi:hypothetical protein
LVQPLLEILHLPMLDSPSRNCAFSSTVSPTTIEAKKKKKMVENQINIELLSFHTISQATAVAVAGGYDR